MIRSPNSFMQCNVAPIFFQTCATCSELPSSISSMATHSCAHVVSLTLSSRIKLIRILNSKQTGCEFIKISSKYLLLELLEYWEIWIILTFILTLVNGYWRKLMVFNLRVVGSGCSYLIRRQVFGHDQDSGVKSWTKFRSSEWILVQLFKIDPSSAVQNWSRFMRSD